MHSFEPHVASQSDYYVYTPSTTAKRLFFYPICTGHFIYEPEYDLKRKRYDSFLIMLIAKGTCLVTTKQTSFTASAGEVVLLDCYAPHEYSSKTGWEALWLHFDGPMARAYYEQITRTSGCLLTPRDISNVERSLSDIYNTFRETTYIQEATISASITTILTELLLADTKKEDSFKTPLSLSDTISYLNEHFAEPISLADLADRASLSIFYFTRRFTKETGMTPHQYLLATRINCAKFLLKTTDLPVKTIGFTSGFTSESSFCTAFKKWEHLTPSAYRSLDVPPQDEP